MPTASNIRLKIFGLPVIESLDDFSNLTNISKSTIYQLSQNADKYYYVYSITKRTGGKRIICQPNRKLKALQSWILANILNKLKVSPSCKGFESGTSIIDNVFKSIGYNKVISTIFSNICTYKKILPQGSPCSPKIANLICWRLDSRIQGYVGKRGITYTRYADDITFSGNNPNKVMRIVSMIKEIIEDEGFMLNNKKTRAAGVARSRVITGLVLYDNTYGIGVEKYRAFRAKIFSLTKPENLGNYILLNEVKGWLAYLNLVDKTRQKKLSFILINLRKNMTNL